jgi:non-ribosomal peptide synthetase component F
MSSSPNPPTTKSHKPTTPIFLLLSSPYYTEILALHQRFTTEKQALLDRLHIPVKEFRAASSSRQTLLAQAAKEKVDAQVAEIVEYQEQFQRNWVRMVERWAEDIGGKVGRHVKEVVSEMARENDAEGVVNLDGILVAVQVRCSEGN